MMLWHEKGTDEVVKHVTDEVKVNQVCGLWLLQYCIPV